MSGVDPVKFAVALLGRLNAPVNHQNVSALVGWATAEGGSVHNNPFNTTEDAPGATIFNSVGVKSYTNFNEALNATADTLLKSSPSYGYGNIVGALRRSDPQGVGQAIANSSWGTGSLAESSIATALGHNWGVKPSGAVKQVAQQHAMGPGKPTTKTTSKTITEPGVTTKTTTGGGVDYVAALRSALLTPTAINVDGTLPAPSLLSKFETNVGSGAFTTPVVNNVSTSAGQSATITNKTIAQGKAKGSAAASKVANATSAKGPVLGKNGVPINPDGKVVDLHSVGIVTPKAGWNPSGKPVAEWIVPILQYAWNHGWRGTVTSGYRSDAEQTAIYDSGVRPAAVPKSLGGSGSNHEGNAFPAGAVDVASASELSAILEKSPYANLLVYAGAKDPVHFSHPHDGSY